MAAIKLNTKAELLDSDKADRIVIGEIEKSETEKWRVYYEPYRDTIYFHIRLYFLSREGEWIPTKKGLAFELKFAAVMLEAIQFAVAIKADKK